MEPNKTNDTHTHTMRNILIPIIVVVALIIVSIFFSKSSAFSSLKSEQGAAVVSSVTKDGTVIPHPLDPGHPGVPTGSSSTMSTFTHCNGTSDDAIAFCAAICIEAGGTWGPLPEPIFESDVNPGCLISSASVLAPTTPLPPIFKGKITSKHYKILQSFLSSKGYLDQGYNTAKRDLKTRTALKAYQKSIGITATGSLTAATKAKLNMEMSQLFKPATKAVTNSQTTDQAQIEKIINEAIRTKKPVDPNNPLLSTGAVCEQTYSLCTGGCYLSGAASDSTSNCLLTCAQAWLSCHKGFSSK